MQANSSDNYPSVSELIARGWQRLVSRKYVLLGMVVIAAVTTLPLHFVTFPPNVDLPEHVLISKLLFEKLSGVSSLDMEISYFIAYRLIPIIFVTLFFIFQGLGISLLVFPKVVVVLLTAFHSFIVSRITFGRDAFAYGQQRLWTAACIALPAAVAIYSACWFIGFANFTLAITLLLAAIFLTQRYIEFGGFRTALTAFLALLITYSAHPFAPMFWIMWCGASFLASLVLRRPKAIWLRLLSLPLIFLPIALYHVTALSGTEFEDSGSTFWDRPIFIEPGEWYNNRLKPFINGDLLKADAMADSTVFAAAAILLVAFSVFLAFYSRAELRLKALSVTSIIFLVGASIVHEKFFPIPAPHWLAYDYRFSSAAYAVCLTAAAYVIIRIFFSGNVGGKMRSWIYAAAAIGLLASFSHLYSVTAAYRRYEPSATEYLTQVFAGGDGAKVGLPYSRWHPDGKLIRLYICLIEKDCNPKGTTFESFGGSLYAVRIKSKPVDKTPQDKPRLGDRNVPNNIFFGAPGTAEAQLDAPRGLTVDGSGQIYVADSGNARIKIYDQNGSFVRSFGDRGSAPGQLQGPASLVVQNDGTMFVVDAARNKVLKFKGFGEFVKEWDGPSPGFFAPRDIAIDRSGRLFIVDQGATRIVRLDPNTDQYFTWGSKGSGDTQFHESTGIAVDGESVFVADLGNDRILVFTTAGEYVRQVPVPAWEKYPWHYPDVAYDPQSETIFATNGWKNEILAFDEDGKTREFNFELSGKLDNPSALWIVSGGSKKRVYVLNHKGSNVVYFDIQGTSK